MPDSGASGDSVFVVGVVIFLGGGGFCFLFFCFYLKANWPPKSSSMNSSGDPATPFIREGQSMCHLVEISVVFLSFAYSFRLVYLFIHQTQLCICKSLAFCQRLGGKVE